MNNAVFEENKTIEDIEEYNPDKKNVLVVWIIWLLIGLVTKNLVGND